MQVYDVDRRTGLYLRADSHDILRQKFEMSREHAEMVRKQELLLGKYKPLRDAEAAAFKKRWGFMPIGGGGGQSGTVMDLVYANVASGTAKNTFSTEATPILNDTTGMGAQAQFNPFYFDPAYAKSGKTVRVVARGICSTTATPTYQFIVRLGATGIAASIAWESPAATTLTGIASKGWSFCADIVTRTLAGAGANSTIQGIGELFGDATGFNANSLVLMGWANNAQPGTVATFDYSIANTVNVNVICSASSASNSVQLLQLLVWGLN